ncbi:sensor histidine kinase [Marinobacterium stanieri]|uniref:sensor histidine kinase n=1 Tax=Marinobacterium stanieri TaxID=49186 RepID=UPI00025592C4|nr:sensor histidine kinase [Marinobacterium stanieri]
MRFSTRIILIVGLSTLVLTSLYWLVGWHHIEQLEGQQAEHLQAFIGERADLVMAGELPPEALQFLPQLRLYTPDMTWPSSWPEMSEPGVYALGADTLVLAREVPGTRALYALYLPELQQLLEQEESEVLEAVVAVGGVLLFTLGAMALTLWLLWKQTIPVRRLTQAIADVSPAAPRLESLERTDELGELSRQFSRLLSRTQSFIEREQNFTRFASHELRTPLMTLGSSLALLEEVSDQPMQKKALARMRFALTRMEKLTDSFLWLSREHKDADVSVNAALMQSLLEQLQALTPAMSAVQLELSDGDWSWHIHPFVLSVILDNLLRNALEYGDEGVRIEATATVLRVLNPCAEFQEQTVPEASLASPEHYGYGLQIVEQLCDKANARFQTTRENGWFLAEVVFTAVP